MTKCYKYRLYPNKQQELQIQKNFGCVRFVYNYYLAKRIEVYEKSKGIFNYYACTKDLTELKKDLTWLKEADSTSLQSSLKNLDRAFQKFFKEHAGYPKFKSKKTYKYSYTSKSNGVNIFVVDSKHLQLPKLGIVRISKDILPLNCNQKCFVYFAGRFAYTANYTEQFMEDVRNHRMESVYRDGRYN